MKKVLCLFLLLLAYLMVFSSQATAEDCKDCKSVRDVAQKARQKVEQSEDPNMTAADVKRYWACVFQVCRNPNDFKNVLDDLRQVGTAIKKLSDQKPEAAK